MKIDDSTKKILDRLSAKVNGALGSPIISHRSCSFHEIPLNFYQQFKLYHLYDCSYTPVSHYFVLDNGEQTIFLDGGFESWYSANQIEKPQLSVVNIIDYLRIVYSTYSLGSKKHSVVTSIEDIDFRKMPSNEKFLQIESTIKPPVISFNSSIFTVFICLLDGNKLFEASVNVNNLGEISISDKNLILDDIPVAELVWE